MKVLFIGGTGIISSACAPLAIERGFEVYLLNRGQSWRPTPAGAHVLHGDIRDRNSATAALGDMTFDVVVNWVAYGVEHIEADLAMFRGRTRQYVFISSASAYQTPPVNLPVTESTPLANPFWAYSRNKIACEERLIRAYREEAFPMTIVRPSHTYDCTLLPMQGRWTMVERMRQGKPVIVHGDGSSLWTMTHHRDFAKGFVGLLGNNRAIGDVFHITSDELLTWDQIYEMVGHAAGATPKLVHIPSDVINDYDPVWGAGLLGDKTHSMIFDNSKIKRVVPDFACTIPFARGIEEVIAWYDADPARKVVDETLNATIERMLSAWAKAFNP
jgi:nucleoside-diphosphate-sugar epimerase